MQGAALVLLSAAAFATLPILVKLGLEAELEVQQMLTLRFVAAGLGMVVVASLTEHAFRELTGSELRFAILAGVIWTVQAVALFVALEEVPAAFVSLVLFTYPIIVAAVGVAFLGDRATRRQVLGLALSVIGIAALLGGVTVRVSPALAAAFVAPFLYAAYLLISERMSLRMPALTVAALALSTGGAMMLIYAVARGGVELPVSLEGWLVVAGLSVVPMVGIPSLVAGLARLGATSAAVISTAEPAITVVLAALVLSEAIGVIQLIGGALVVAAVLLIQLDRGTSPRGRPPVRGTGPGSVEAPGPGAAIAADAADACRR